MREDERGGERRREEEGGERRVGGTKYQSPSEARRAKFMLALMFTV